MNKLGVFPEGQFTFDIWIISMNVHAWFLCIKDTKTSETVKRSGSTCLSWGGPYGRVWLNHHHYFPKIHHFMFSWALFFGLATEPFKIHISLSRFLSLNCVILTTVSFPFRPPISLTTARTDLSGMLFFSQKQSSLCKFSL